jgi:YD repeat-containing protein
LDALGRLVEVVEDPGALGLNYLTTYSYDALDNLLGVTQGAPPLQQTRSFQYNSLSLLTSAVNPESGTISYKYDANGNLIEKKDDRIVSGSTKLTITYAYDELNRIKTKTSNDQNRTPSVNYFYDNDPLPLGGFARGAAKCRLVAVTYGAAGASEGSYYGYDTLGRVIRSLQKTSDIQYSMPEYKYDLAGNLISEKYPTGRVITTALTPRAERAASAIRSPGSCRSTMPRSWAIRRTGRSRSSSSAMGYGNTRSMTPCDSSP